MFKIFKYSFFDLSRSWWIYLYFVFYLFVGFGILYLNNDLSSGIVNLLNIVLILSPLVSVIFGTMYYYNSREFIELLLAQPIKRKAIFFGHYLGLSIPLSLCFILGASIPFIFYGILTDEVLTTFVTLIILGVVLKFIFIAIAFNIAMRNENKIKGFGMAIFLWLLFAVVYDGLFLLTIIYFNDYPLETFSIIASIFNPIDLARILIILKLDVSAMLGYTGAVFNKYFSSAGGIIVSSVSLMIWLAALIWLNIRKMSKNDF